MTKVLVAGTAGLFDALLARATSRCTDLGSAARDGNRSAAVRR
jgi:hypothetical protein